MLNAAEQRFASPPNETRLAELESLRDFLKETVVLIDSKTKEIAAPAERLRTLLMSKDKKATILEMAGETHLPDCMRSPVDRLLRHLYTTPHQTSHLCLPAPALHTHATGAHCCKYVEHRMCLWLLVGTSVFEHFPVSDAESNQIDKPLLNLLQQNADAARAAGQAEPAEFMEKIKAAASKFLLKS